MDPKSPEALDRTFLRTRGPGQQTLPLNLKEAVEYDADHWDRPQEEGQPSPVEAVVEGCPTGTYETGEQVDREMFGTPTSTNKVHYGEFVEGHTPNPASAAFLETGKRGQLSPDWVEALMGWPPGWTGRDPVPAEVYDDWFWGFAADESRRFGVGPWLSGAWESGIPRVGVEIPDRVARLKAVGNGQVPLCAAAAFLALTETFRQLDVLATTPIPEEISFEELLGL